MPAEPDPERLQRLEERIAEAKRATAPPPPTEQHYSQASQGWRMVIELVSGLGIGFVVGYGLDWLFGTIPVFLVVFTLLGFAAGVKTMLRTAQEIQKGQHPGAPGKDEGN
ncbi:MAG: AtpZ/AtpI family protein [Paracoccaceae bacterium]